MASTLPRSAIALHLEAWGNGYATEGVHALIARAFDGRGFDCIRAETMAVSLGARRVMEKAGMQLVRTIYPHYSNPIPGSDRGEVIYEICISDPR